MAGTSEPVSPLEYEDPVTGAAVIRWTAGAWKDQHLYFTCPSVTLDDRWLVFLSERSGSPNLYAVDRQNLSLYAVSKNLNGLLRSYVYPYGGVLGLSKASPCLDPFQNRIYYIQDNAVVRSDLKDQEPHPIWTVPGGWWTAFTGISPDGKLLCVPCTDGRAFPGGLASQWQQMDVVPRLMGEMGLTSRLYLIDTDTGQSERAAEVPFWVTHVQFDPSGKNRIIFNQEGTKEVFPQWPNRIWKLDPAVGDWGPLYDEPIDGCRTHENWSSDGSAIVYHGYEGGGGSYHSPYIERRDWSGRLLGRYPTVGPKCAHVTMLLDDRTLVMDRLDGFISTLGIDDPPDAERLLCRHD